MLETAQAAQAVATAAAAEPTGWTPGTLATWGGLIALALTGWNAYLQSKLTSLSELWKWKEGFDKAYNNARLQDVKDYATKAEMAALGSRMDKQFDEIKALINGLGKKLDDQRREQN